MIDSGFGDISFDSRPDLCLEGLKPGVIPVNPVFLQASDPPCHHSELLSQEVCLCRRFRLVGSPVQPYGDTSSKYVFVGCDPDEYEVEKGELLPSETQTGAVFDEYLECLGLVREDVYITNILSCRASGSGYPSPGDIWACSSFRKREFIDLTSMEYIFTMGDQAFNSVTGIYGSVSSFFGRFFEAVVYGRQVKIIPLYHPNMLPRDATIRENMYSILRNIGGG